MSIIDDYVPLLMEILYLLKHGQIDVIKCCQDKTCTNNFSLSYNLLLDIRIHTLYWFFTVGLFLGLVLLMITRFDGFN